MTTNTTFRRAADRIRQSAFILPIFIIYLLLLAISCLTSWEDYWTSFWGYEALPTAEGYWYVAYAVALLPQVGQAAAAYIVIALADNEEDRLYMIIGAILWVLLFFIDFYTDMFFRNGLDWNVGLEVWIAALLQTVGIFTLGSEVAFIVGFGMVCELLPDAVVESFGLFNRIKMTWRTRMSQAQTRLDELSRPRPRGGR